MSAARGLLQQARELRKVAEQRLGMRLTVIEVHGGLALGVGELITESRNEHGWFLVKGGLPELPR